MLDVGREQVLAHRVAAQGLHRDACGVHELAVLDIGVQEAMGQPAALAFAARLPLDVDVCAARVGPGEDLALAWTWRGAPHVHRRADLDLMAAALWPLSEADAAGRLNETGPSVERAGITALDQFATAVEAMRTVVTSSIAKGAASTAITQRLPEAMQRECRPCRAKHISDSAMRAASLAAGVELEPGTAPPVLVRRAKAKRPKQADPVALARLATAYLSLLGPAGVSEFAGYAEARRADVSEVWPDGLSEVRVDGRAAWLPSEQVDDLRTAPPPDDVVRLLGPFDPYLQARDRDLLVPDKAARKTLWPVLGRPGVLLVGGEVAGAWRTKTTKKKLTITLEAFVPLARTVAGTIAAEAERVAAVRGVPDVEVVRKD